MIDLQLKKSAEIISLLDSDVYLQLQETPSRLRQMIHASKSKWIVIDEIQRIPELLNEVHLAVQQDSKKDLRFLLTGSSARRLKRENANMLGGRARKAALFPLTIQEISNSGTFDLNRYLTFGGLPAVYLSDDPYLELRDYLDTYLTDEIKTEAGVRNLPAFSRFLRVAALCQGQQINFTKMGNDAQVNPNTIREHFQILLDTLLGIQLDPWREGAKRKPVASAKFYFVDCGIANAAAEFKHITVDSERFGIAFEQAICMEINAYISYKQPTAKLNYWRTQNDLEVDFVINSEIAIEAKSSISTSQRDHKNLLKITEEAAFKRLIVVNRSPMAQQIEGVDHLPYQNFVEELWAGKII